MTASDGALEQLHAGGDNGPRHILRATFASGTSLRHRESALLSSLLRRGEP